ncbi:H-NS family nucleoid-associated regulatory protein [Xylophilus sp. Leaf220]|jgi:DNA-binding protein H-NS|uniref:H-NS histone family protein n=1 Tax=Xylophilus sp. Leaf220 TaxID=1735686 RepID=UPI0007004E70|nr:H-NS histone family protein [Xylophilus sp. Leaf220]KQM79536.1 histone [Xylophilus sp. Leaf220]
MNNLKDLESARAKLDADIARAYKLESEAALAKVRELVAEFGFTAQQVFPWKLPEKKVAAKYLDEKTGATWTGRGKPPKWIAGKDREEFLVDKPVEAPRGPFLAEMAAAAAQRGLL